MGTADIIPGISGGTIAFILGIYEEFIQSIKSFDLPFLQLLFRFRIREAFQKVSWKFLGSILLGIICAILTLSKSLSWLLHNKPILINSFFFGLILATIPIVMRVMKQWTVAKGISVVVAAMGTYFFVGMAPVSTPEALWFVFLSGAVAISAMIMPGVSGAFILVLFGKYSFILDAVNHRDFVVLGVFILGIGVGVITFVRVLSWLFKNYHDATIAVITGVVIGSLNKIWPWKETIREITTSHGKIIPIEQINIWPASINNEVGFAVGLMVIGFVMALNLNVFGNKKS